MGDAGIELTLPMGLPELPKDMDETLSKRSHSGTGLDCPAGTSRRQTLHIRSKEEEWAVKKAENMSYIADKNVGAFLSVMLMELFKDMPENPIQWCAQFFLRHDDVIEAKEKWEHQGSLDITDDKRVWSAAWRIPFVMDELLSAILEEKPEQPDSFAASWFRWNAKSIQRKRHGLPEGWSPQKAFDT
eukprot:TRINITY_DN38019_c0_g1_i1.p1 TRINITY_DN38019_c0_g1~~TRINITY_DN38019_c0_g1_i1.p1  ORF type:complete len:187 (+),score=43.31 TRINITY_DN38019_c0_g1_i1:287-847(+)